MATGQIGTQYGSTEWLPFLNEYFFNLFYYQAFFYLTYSSLSSWLGKNHTLYSESSITSALLQPTLLPTTTNTTTMNNNNNNYLQDNYCMLRNTFIIKTTLQGFCFSIFQVEKLSRPEDQVSCLNQTGSKNQCSSLLWWSTNSNAFNHGAVMHRYTCRPKISLFKNDHSYYLIGLSLSQWIVNFLKIEAVFHPHRWIS